MYGLIAVLLTTILIGKAAALCTLKLRHPVPYLLTIDDVLRTDRSVTDDMGDSVIDRLEIKQVQRSQTDVPRRIHLKTEKREISIDLEPRKTIMSPDLRVTVIDGEKAEQTPVHASLKDIFFHGKVEGVDGGVASLMKHNNCWKGVVYINGEALAVNHEQSTGKHLLIKIINDDVVTSIPSMQTAEQKIRDFKNERNKEQIRISKQTRNNEQIRISKQTRNNEQKRSNERKRNSEQKRSNVDNSNLKIELGVYMDHNMYNYMESNNVEDPIAELQRIALLTVNTVDVYYQKSSLGVPIDVVVAKLVIIKKDILDFGEPENVYGIISKFCAWEGQYRNPRGLSHDIALMLTGINVYGSNRRPVGVANLRGACKHFGGFSCIVSEGLGLYSGYVTAHEMGHNLAMMHDGTENDCTSGNYIMAPSKSISATDFSPCSKAEFETYFEYLDDFNINCLRKDFSEKIIDSEGDLLPGERLLDDEHCRSIYGPLWHDFLGEYENSTYCEITLCTNGTNIVKSVVPPIPGTRCGENKICWIAECVDRSVFEATRHWEHNTSPPPEPLTLDELCVKYGSEENYTKGVAYDGTGDSETWRGLCDNGLVCALEDYSAKNKDSYHPVPPGTACYKDMVCKHFRCKHKDTPDEPMDSSDVVEVVENPVYRQPLSEETINAITKFCTTHASETAVPMTPKECGTILCEDEFYYYDFRAYFFSICPDGQICTFEGMCVEDSGELLPGELTKEELKDADKLCKEKYGEQYKSVCRRPALSFSATVNDYCAGGLCENIACLAFVDWDYYFESFATPQGSPCGGGKQCGPNGCSGIFINQKLELVSNRIHD